MKKLVRLIGVLTLAGCAAIDYETVPVDSASPLSAETQGRCPATLAPGARCTARVQADQWSSPTGIQVKAKGESYCIAVLPNQVWFDASRRNIPPYGEKGSWLMNLAKKRHEAGFFSLMVDVQSHATVGETAKPVTEELPGARYTAQGAGELVLYPNDAVGPSYDPEYFYRNNSGYIWVNITRCE